MKSRCSISIAGICNVFIFRKAVLRCILSCVLPCTIFISSVRMFFGYALMLVCGGHTMKTLDKIQQPNACVLGQRNGNMWMQFLDIHSSIIWSIHLYITYEKKLYALMVDAIFSLLCLHFKRKEKVKCSPTAWRIKWGKTDGFRLEDSPHILFIFASIFILRFSHSFFFCCAPSLSCHPRWR